MMRHTIAPTSIIQRLFRCNRYTSNILLALRPKLFKLIALSLVVECLKKKGTIVMKRQWALTTLSQEDLTQPNFIVSTRQNLVEECHNHNQEVTRIWYELAWVRKAKTIFRCLVLIYLKILQNLFQIYTPMKKEKSPQNKMPLRHQRIKQIIRHCHHTIH